MYCFEVRRGWPSGQPGDICQGIAEMAVRVGGGHPPRPPPACQFNDDDSEIILQYFHLI